MKHLTKLFIPLIVLFCSVSTTQAQNPSFQLNNTKMNQFLRAVNELYVDTVNFDKLVEEGMISILKELDPHSTYIPPKEVARVNEPLQGEFDGIGVAYQLIKDTITIVEVIIDGPSEKVGLMVGDKIIKVDTLVACGKTINNSWVQKHLRGTKGSKVKITVKRGRSQEPLEFTITRDKIPQNSINVFFMVDENTGYIRLERFAKNSKKEFIDALTRLQARKMKNLIFDLRGNSGGYLSTAFEIADEFISDKQIIVYTKNVRNQGEQYYSTQNGNFEKGKLIVLIDENSASASEIVSGAIQDHDRGLIMGRRSFGKGLVQRPLNLADNAELRLTISRYYTPSGRCIQKSYDGGREDYYNDMNNRSKHGEFLSADSIHFPDSLKYTTTNGRTVYGGGGIMPDVFIPIDTTKYSTLYNEMVRKGIFSGFSLNYMQSHRNDLKVKYPTIEVFVSDFKVSDELFDEVMKYSHNEGVKDSVPLLFSQRLKLFVNENSQFLDSVYTNINSLNDYHQLQQKMDQYLKNSYEESMKYRNLSNVKEYIVEAIRFEFARNLYTYGEAYQIFLESDECFQQALNIMRDEKVFKKFKVDR